jgi:hypothetical protein
LRLGSCNAVVVSSPACARECFTELDVTFANRPRLPSWQFLSHGLLNARHVQLWPALANPPPRRGRAAPLDAPCQLHVRRHLR